MKLAALLVTAVLGWTYAPDPPAAPTGLGATPGNGQVTLDWSDNSPAPSGYNVYRATASGGSYAKVNSELLTTSAYTNTNLTSGTPYYFVVRAQTGSEESADSAEVTATPTGTDTTAPNQPIITSTTRKTRDTTPSTSGTAEPGTTVRVYAGTTEIGSTNAAANGTWTVANPSALGSEGIYSVTARATDAASNQSIASVAIQVTLDTTAPPPPTNLRVLPTPAFIDVEWAAAVANDVLGYRVYRRTNGGAWTLLNTGGLVLDTRYRDSAVSPGNTYQYRVTAVDNAVDY